MTIAGYSIWTISIVVVITIAVAAAGAMATELGPWYAELKKPQWQPPDWLFGPAWTLIFTLAAAAAVISYTHASDSGKTAVIAVFVINAVLNILWSVLFFKLRSPMMALYEVTLLWLSIVSIMVVVMPHSRLAALLVVPYLLWVSFAGFLTYTIVKLNAPLVSAS